SQTSWRKPKLGGQASLDLTEEAGHRACKLLNSILDPNDHQFQANLAVVAAAIGKVQPGDIAQFQLDSEWRSVTAALGDVASAIGLSDRSVTHVLQALDASRPPAQPKVSDLLAELAICRDSVCSQAEQFHGDVSLVKSAIKHQRADQHRRRMRGVVATG